jgi:hypothetical protein
MHSRLSRSRVRFLPLAAAGLLAALPSAALAQPPPDAAPPDAPPPPAAPPRDVATDTRPDAWAGAPRPWLYATDPTAPPPGHVMASLGVGYAQVDRGAARPFAANIAHAGAVFDAGVEVGVLRFMSLYGQGLLSGEGSEGGVHGGGMLGVSFYPLPAKSPIDLSISGGYLRELGGGNGAWGRVSAAASWGNARVVVTALGSHIFEQGRDPVDLLLTAGASYAVLPILRLGVEYVVQDLEGAWETDEPDGGIRHFLGPTASLELAKRVHLTAGPSFGLSKGSPSVQGRVAAAYAF